MIDAAYAYAYEYLPSLLILAVTFGFVLHGLLRGREPNPDPVAPGSSAAPEEQGVPAWVMDVLPVAAALVRYDCVVHRANALWAEHVGDLGGQEFHAVRALVEQVPTADGRRATGSGATHLYAARRLPDGWVLVAAFPREAHVHVPTIFEHLVHEAPKTWKEHLLPFLEDACAERGRSALLHSPSHRERAMHAAKYLSSLLERAESMFASAWTDPQAVPIATVVQWAAAEAAVGGLEFVGAEYLDEARQSRRCVRISEPSARIFFNQLVQNAAGHGRSSAARVRVDTITHDGTRSDVPEWVRISFVNNGEPFDPLALRYVNEQKEVERPNIESKATYGSGYGLLIADAVARRHGGSFERPDPQQRFSEKVPGVGFTLSLPLVPEVTVAQVHREGRSSAGPSDANAIRS